MKYKRLLSCIALLLLAAVVGIALTSAKSSRRVRDGELKTSRYVYSGGVLGGKQHGYGVCRYKTAMSTTAIGTAVIKKVLVVWISQMAACLSESGSAVCFHPRKGARFKAGKRVYGIDVAKYQKKIDWDKLSLRADASGRVYAGRRKDTIFSACSLLPWSNRQKVPLCRILISKRNFREAKSHGIIRGAYHFLSIQSDVDSQGAKFYRQHTFGNRRHAACTRSRNQ